MTNFKQSPTEIIKHKKYHYISGIESNVLSVSSKAKKFGCKQCFQLYFTGELTYSLENVKHWETGFSPLYLCTEKNANFLTAIGQLLLNMLDI